MLERKEKLIGYKIEQEVFDDRFDYSNGWDKNKHK